MGAHKTVILRITKWASVRRDWQRNNGYLVRAGYPLFFCRHEKQSIHSQLSGITTLNQSHPFRDFSKNLKKVWKHWNSSALLIIEVQTHNTDLKKRLTAFAAKHPQCCRQTDDDEQGGLTFDIEKGRLSFRLTAPHSEERRRAASEQAKQNDVHKKVADLP